MMDANEWIAKARQVMSEVLERDITGAGRAGRMVELLDAQDAPAGQRWEPVEGGERIECWHGDCGAYARVHENGDGLLIHNRERNGVEAAIVFPDDYALCRRVATPQAQEGQQQQMEDSHAK